MADDDGWVANVFVYMGGDQVVPRNVRFVRVHKSVKIIRPGAFRNCTILAWIEMHDGVEIIGRYSFTRCRSLRQIELFGVRIIEDMAFDNCTALKYVEFGDKLEIIGKNAFNRSCLRKVKIPKVREIKCYAFSNCKQIIDVELSEDLERIEGGAFNNCPRLRCVALPLKDNLFQTNDDQDPRVEVFYEPRIDFRPSGRGCPELDRVDLVGGIHKTISSLHLEDWEIEMLQEIGNIKWTLHATHISEKTTVIQQWMERVLQRIEHFKLEHYALLEKATTLLELALWKTKLLDETFGEVIVGTEGARTTRSQWKRARLESRQVARVTCGADIIIKNVVPFLKLE